MLWASTRHRNHRRTDRDGDLLPDVKVTKAVHNVLRAVGAVAWRIPWFAPVASVLAFVE